MDTFLYQKLENQLKKPDSVEKKTIEMGQSNLNELKRIAKIGTSRKNGVDIEVDGFGLISDVVLWKKFQKELMVEKQRRILL